MTGEAGPEYQRLMRQIRAGIISGEYPVGSPIPSTTELTAASGKSRPVVRRAIDQLKAEGILEGHQGKGVFVKALPEDADRGQADLKAVSERVDGLEDRVAGYEDLRAEVGRLRADILYLYDRFAVPYDHGDGGAHDDAEQAAGRRRPRR